MYSGFTAKRFHVRAVHLTMVNWLFHFPRVLFTSKNCKKHAKTFYEVPALTFLFPTPLRRNAEKYVLGTKSRVNVRVRVTNRREGSYESMVYVTLPAGVDYINIDRVQPKVSS